MVRYRDWYRNNCLATHTPKALHLTFVTASGLKNNAQAGMIQNQVILYDLFGEKG